MFLVDAYVLSEPTKPEPGPRVIDWLRTNQRDLAVDPVVPGEVRFGILLLPRGRRNTSDFSKAKVRVVNPFVP